MLRNIRKCTVAEAHRVFGRMNWDMTLDELDKFIGLVIARAILGQRGLPVKCLWITTWGYSMFNKTLSRRRFKEIMRFLCFHVKSKRRQRVILDKFCLTSSLWKPFVENSEKAYVPSPYITVDEQLLPCKAKCRFIQYMPNKPDRQNLSRITLCRLLLFTWLMQPIFKRGYNVTCDNFFTSLDVALRLAEQKCSIVGTARQNRREPPQAAKRQQQQYKTSLFTFIQTAVVTLTSYQCEKKNR